MIQNKYYIDLRKKLDVFSNYEYESLGVINDYLTNDIDIQSAAVVYDFNTILKQTNKNTNNDKLLHTFGVLLFDIYGNFNLYKKLPLKVKFQNFMNFTQEIDLPEELYNTISDRQPYIYECFFWSEESIRKVFLGKINKKQIDNMKEILISIESCSSPIINDILYELNKVLPEKNSTLLDYITGKKSASISNTKKNRITSVKKTRKIIHL
jgi:hypothetical protein